MTRLPKAKLPKQNNKKVGRSAKHKTSEKALARKAYKAEKATHMDDEAAVPLYANAEERDAAKAERKKANKANNKWKHPALSNVTSKQGPRNVSGK
jgi:hypothetical protein